MQTHLAHETHSRSRWHYICRDVCQSQLHSKPQACFVSDALKMRYNGLNVTDLQVIFDTMNNVSFCNNISGGFL